MEFFGISLAAWMSILALTIVIIISCFFEELNVGVLSISFAIIVAAFFMNESAGKVVMGFPLSLFMILVGVTFMFSMAQVNGTLGKITSYSIRLCGGNMMLLPFIIFLLTVFITTIGPGNIAGTALLAPICMAIAGRVGMSGFCMTLIVVGAANSACFSPFAPTGIISHGLIGRMADQIPNLWANWSPTSLDWKIYFNSMMAQGPVTIVGFLVFGGWAWMMKHKGATVDINTIAPKPEPFDKNQWITVICIITLIFLVVVPALPGMKGIFPKWVLLMAANVGTLGFVLAGIMMLLNVADSKAAVKGMPWFVILMVCGVTVLIEVMERSGGLAAMSSIIGAVSGPATVNFWLGLVTGVISAYSSSSGVVMPAFLPLVPGLLKLVPGSDAIAMISSVNIGAHLVDTSPLSTLGALCIACAAESEDKAKLFRNLLIWGLSMSIVGAIVCWLFFGILGI
ncbi:MAG TPA: SLC13 family permease [Syntrophales bacterium]|nr:SLC13 family permease [Syntrophales bacterium]